MRTICTPQLSGRTVRDGDRLGNNRVLTVGLLAGLCGGAAEVLWVDLYSGATHTSLQGAVRDHDGLGRAENSSAAALALAVARLGPAALAGRGFYLGVAWLFHF